MSNLTAKQGPCNDCPWRKDAPAKYWHPDHFKDIAESCRNDGMATMLCHKSNQCNTKMVCAGWVASQGTESIGVRILMMKGVVDPEKDYSGGHDLYTFDEMLHANNIRPRGQYDHNIERLKELQRKMKS